MIAILSNFVTEFALLSVSILCVIKSLYTRFTNSEQDKRNSFSYFIVALLILTIYFLLINHDSIVLNITDLAGIIANLERNKIDIGVILITIIWIFFDGEVIKEGVFRKNERLFYVAVISLFAVIISKTDSLLTFYVSTECQVLALYFIMLTNIEHKSLDVIIKYFIINILASAFLIVGIVITFYNFKTLHIAEIVAQVGDSNKNLLIGMVIFYVAIIFKIGAGPAVFWLTEVYYRISSSSIYIISILLKLPLFLFLFKTSTILGLIDGMSWAIIISIAISTIPIVRENRMRIFLCYNDSISALYLLLVMYINGSGLDDGKIIWYFILQLLSFVPYALICEDLIRIYKEDNVYSIVNLRSNKKYLLLSIVTILSISSIPPFCGFWAKIYIFNAIVSTNFSLVATVLIISTIMIVYSAKILSIMYSDKNHSNQQIHYSRLLCLSVLANFVVGIVYIIRL